MIPRPDVDRGGPALGSVEETGAPRGELGFPRTAGSHARNHRRHHGTSGPVSSSTNFPKQTALDREAMGTAGRSGTVVVTRR